MATNKELEQRVNELFDCVVALTEHIQAMSTSAPAAKARGERDYGPKSKVDMTERMALRILIGRYRNTSVRAIADTCGLSRGQVYSLRGRYTMKTVWKTADAINLRRAERNA